MDNRAMLVLPSRREGKTANLNRELRALKRKGVRVFKVHRAPSEDGKVRLGGNFTVEEVKP